MAECRHDFHWRMSDCNEAGWICVNCKHKPGEPPGFSPQTDRAEIARKVESVLLTLHESDVIYVSNSDCGDGIVANVVGRCRDSGLFDQWTIARFILESEAPSHAKYWKDISDGMLSGKDPRRRCHCGRLSTMTIGDRAYCSTECQAQKELPW